MRLLLPLLVACLRGPARGGAVLLHRPGGPAPDGARARAAAEINGRPGVLWRAGVSPRFSGLPVGASEVLCGAVRTPRGESLQQAHGAPRAPAALVPRRFDAAEAWPLCAPVITNVRDQSGCGCCFAFAVAGTASDRLCIATGGRVAVQLSEEELCFCSRSQGCEGGQMGEAWKFVVSRGLSTGSPYARNVSSGNRSGFCKAYSLPPCYHHIAKRTDASLASCPRKRARSPSCPRKCDPEAQSPYNDFERHRYRFRGQIMYFGLGDGVDEIALQMMTYGPLQTSLQVYADFELYISGIYHHLDSEPFIGWHAVKMVGWGAENGTQYWRVQNSWNDHWGEDGHFRIVRGINECQIESEVIANQGDGKWFGPGATEE